MTTEAARVAEVEGTHSSAHACTHGTDDARRYELCKRLEL